MHVGMALVFQNPDDKRDDREIYEAELGFGLRAEALGFESLWTVDHHFSGYSMSPDPVQILTWFAGQTTDLRLGTAVIVLPWHDPVQIAEQVTLLDNMSGGLLLLGIGRGLARLEYDGFRVDRITSRERFVEYAAVLLDGLEQDYVAYDGDFIRQPRRDLRPRPQRSFVGRTWAAERPDQPMTPPLSGGFVFVDESADRAEELAHEYIGGYLG